MHYYQFNIADYRKDTVHLTPIEHYIYRTLIDWYYLDESPIPKETQLVLRRLQLGSEHKENLENVFNDFFVSTEKGWLHKRIEAEISGYSDKCERNRANGKRGGRPKKTQSVLIANQNKSETNPNHKPLTSKPITNEVLSERVNKLPGNQVESHSQTDSLASKLIDPGFTPNEAAKLMARQKGIDIERETKMFIAHYTANGVMKSDWQAQFRKWLLHAEQLRADAKDRPSSARNKSKNNGVGDHGKYQAIESA